MRFTFCILFFLTYSFAYCQPDLNNGLVAHYPFDGNAQDEGPNGNHGTLIGGNYSTDRFGIANSALVLNGIDEYVSFTNNEDFNPPLPVSISVWVFVRDRDFNSIFKNDFRQNYYDGIWLNTVPSGVITVGFGDGGLVGPFSRRSFESNDFIELNTWVHLVGVIRGPFDMDIYLNGEQLCGRYSGSGNDLNYEGNPGVSGTSDGFAQDGIPNRYYNGMIDDLRLYDRALTKEEIMALADAPLPEDKQFTICLGDSLPLNAGQGQSYRWIPGDGLSCIDCPNPIAFPTRTINYQTIIEQGPCSFDTLNTLIEVEPCQTCEDLGLSSEFSVLLGDLDILAKPDSIHALSLSSRWDWGDGIEEIFSEQIDSLSHSYAEAGIYTVCLSLSDTTLGGEICQDSTCMLITAVAPCVDSSFVPNVFSPNNDGLHDTFVIQIDCPLDSYSLNIYNRWGNQVFHSLSPANSWDGTQRDKPLPEGVYYWNLQYVFKGESFSQTGSVTILR